MRNPGCRDCQQLTSGDCGKHGPIYVPATIVPNLETYVQIDPWQRIAQLEAELARLQALPTLDGSALRQLRDHMAQVADQWHQEYLTLQAGHASHQVKQWVKQIDALLTGDPK